MKKEKSNVAPKVIETAFHRLKDYYQSPATELTYETPFQLLIAVVLSAQCTDAQVNKSTPALFAKYPTPKKMAVAPIEELEKLVKSCGFFRMKAKAIQSTARDLSEKFGGEVPKRMDELVSLAGVGRKTASVVLNQAFDIPAIAVDTHVKRVSNRLGWSRHDDPEKIEQELKDLVPIEWWSSINGFLILHGRRICDAKKPKCSECFLADQCPSRDLEAKILAQRKPKAPKSAARPRQVAPKVLKRKPRA